MEEKCISKIKINDSLYNIKDEELRKALEKLIGNSKEEKVITSEATDE